MIKISLSPNFISVVTSIKMSQDAVELAQTEVSAEFNALPAHEKEILYAAFPRNPEEFSNVLAYWLLKLSEANQANFGMENIKEPNTVYREMIQNNQLVVFSTVPYSHVFVYRGQNSWKHALKNTVNDCNLVTKYHYFLTSAVKRFVLIYISALCRTSTERALPAPGAPCSRRSPLPALPAPNAPRPGAPRSRRSPLPALPAPGAPRSRRSPLPALVPAPGAPRSRRSPLPTLRVPAPGAPRPRRSPLPASGALPDPRHTAWMQRRTPALAPSISRSLAP